MVNDKCFNNLENKMLSLSLIENIKIEDEECQKCIQHSFHNSFARYLVAQLQNKKYFINWS